MDRLHVTHIRFWSMVASILLAFSVMFGAFGAHALKGVLDDYSHGIYEKAVLYQFFHAFGLLIVPQFVVLQMITERAAVRISFLLFAGIFFFSGSLYCLALTGIRWFGAITPIGGVSFILAWGFLAYALMTQKNN